MSQTKRAATVFASVLLGAAPAFAASSEMLRVLVTNDDGVAAPGIDALVTALTANPNLQVTVVPRRRTRAARVTTRRPRRRSPSQPR